ncbi:S8 family serine peptidase [Nitriliruptor alkaliphilus]|uniref:S8 family serine peptidase n=1 Tax=Nitriliruptor alkaliphilus TaxID=427918 RepID=UPI0006960340|nr:S8 family serine peptidase [Nitriliruptor alkaliphilus]
MGGTSRAPQRWWSLVLVALAGIGLVLGSGATAVAQGAGDPYRSEQWNLDRIRTDEAWRITRGEGVVVAVVDTGVALDHPDLFDRIVKRDDGSVVGINLVDGDLDPSDEHGHGTLVAGVIAAAADNGWGVAGVAPEARILPVRVLDAAGSGRSEDVGRGIRWAVDNGADIVNVSLEAVAPTEGGSRVPGVPTDAVRYADERGVLVIAAAGNQPGAASAYPADSPIILVGAVDRDDRSTAFSTVDRRDGFVAPGVEILSTWCRRTRSGCDVASAPYGMAEGTSFAAPHVSGVAALLVAAGYDAVEVRERLTAGAVDLGEPGPDREYGVGRVDAAASLGAAPRATTRSVPEPTSTSPSRPPAEPEPAADVEPEVTAAPAPPPEPVEESVEVAPEEPLVVEVPRADPEPVEVNLDGAGYPEPTVPAADDGTHLVGLDLGAPPAGGAAPDLWLRLVAAAMVALAMLCWSSVARAEA